jgi:hypothetical protein
MFSFISLILTLNFLTWHECYRRFQNQSVHRYTFSVDCDGCPEAKNSVLILSSAMSHRSSEAQQSDAHNVKKDIVMPISDICLSCADCLFMWSSTATSRR